MLDNLSNALKNSIKKILGASLIDEATVNEFIREIQRALIRADVNVKVVLQMTKELKEEILAGAKKNISREFIIKLLYDKLVEILGTGEEVKIEGKPFKIVLVGLFGSGKTTTSAKLAKYYSKRGKKVALLALDTFRPAAYDQLKQLGEKINVPVFGDPNAKDPVDVIEKFESEFPKYDILIVDTSGRNALDEEMIDEVRRIKEKLNPNQIWLVLSADIGQGAKEQAEAFKEIGTTGVIITKLDGSAKGGGALTACAISKVPVRFIGVGEKIDDLEKFDPKRFVSRLLGMGDLEALLEKAKEQFKEEEVEDLEKKLLSGKFNLLDFYKQIEAISGMGTLKKIISMIPGLSFANLPEELLKDQEKNFKKFRVIMDSMTKFELEHPEKLNRSRIERIAKGAGVSVSDVRNLIKQYEQMKKMTKKLKGKNLDKLLKRYKGKIPFPMG